MVLSKDSEPPAGAAGASFKRRGREKTVSFGDEALDRAVKEEAAKARAEEERAKEEKKRQEVQRKWKVGPRYEAREFIGSGSYGCVCEAMDRETKQPVAIKKTEKVFEDLMDARRTLREIAILSLLSHDNVVKLIDVFAPNDAMGDFSEVYAVMEVCDSDLKKLLRTSVHLAEAHVRRLLWTMLCGLKYVHSAGIYHRDLKPGNCLVNQDCTVKICDFGLARAMGPQAAKESHNLLNLRFKKETQRHLTGHVVTRWYRAPELILLQERYTEAIDVWSAGCIFAELLGMYDGISPKERGPLFPGQACFPLSPHGAGEEQAAPVAGAYSHAKHDQLEMIFDIIGTPTEAELGMLDDREAKKYIVSFAKRQGCGFKTKFPQADSEDRDLLRRMIRFNPEERWSAEALLDHKIFTQVRERQKEIKAPGPFSLGFREEQEISETRLREYMRREMRKFRPHIDDRPASRSGGRTLLANGWSGSRRGSKASNPGVAQQSGLPAL